VDRPPYALCSAPPALCLPLRGSVSLSFPRHRTMSLEKPIQEKVYEYVQKHLPNDEWYLSYFDFVTDADLRERLAEEFKAARSVYKLFRGIDASDWWLRAQVRIQILQYASIYEAVIHHILFDRLGAEESVRRLVEYSRLVRIDIPQHKQAALQRALDHDSKVIIPTYQGIGRTDVSKVRFDDKVSCAVGLGLIEEDLGNDLIATYEARNAIHLHAELRKNLTYELNMARTAYRRLAPFRSQLVESMQARGLLLQDVVPETSIDDEG